MATLTITANIQPLSATTIVQKTAGEALAENDAVFIVTDSGTGTVGTVKKAVNTSAEAALVYGFAVQPSKSGGDVGIAVGDFEVDASTFAAGECYVVSSTAGKVEPIADSVATDYIGVVGFSYDVDQFCAAPKYVGVHA